YHAAGPGSGTYVTAPVNYPAHGHRALRRGPVGARRPARPGDRVRGARRENSAIFAARAKNALFWPTGWPAPRFRACLGQKVTAAVRRGARPWEAIALRSPARAE